MRHLARKVVKRLENEEKNQFEFLYKDNLDIKSKIKKIVKEIYG